MAVSGTDVSGGTKRPLPDVTTVTNVRTTAYYNTTFYHKVKYVRAYHYSTTEQILLLPQGGEWIIAVVIKTVWARLELERSRQLLFDYRGTVIRASNFLHTFLTTRLSSSY